MSLRRLLKKVAYVSGIPVSLKGATDTAPAQAIEAGQGPLIASAAVLGFTAAPALAAELGAGSSFAASTAEAGADIYAGTGGGMSAFTISDVTSFLRTGLDVYGAVRGNGGSGQVMQTMGALPPIVGRALPMIAGGAYAVGRAAGAAMRSAQIYCRRNPAWCAQIGGTAAIMSMIQGGQLPVIKRRRGRGLTPSDLRSFRRVANLIRGFCPTVRRIPNRSLHVRKTGITHA